MTEEMVRMIVHDMLCHVLPEVFARARVATVEKQRKLAGTGAEPAYMACEYTMLNLELEVLNRLKSVKVRSTPAINLT